VTVELGSPERPIGDAGDAPPVPPLVTEVTTNAAAELGLEEGKAVYVILKTAGCVVYGGRA
jgi:hypothetical protein